MKSILCLIALLLLPLPILASDADQKVTYWVAETDTTGFTIQNIAVDLPLYIGTTQQQPAGIKNVSLVSVILRDGVLVRPTRSVYSFIINYDEATAAASVQGALPALGSLQRTGSYLVTNYLFNNRTTYNLSSPLKLMRTIVDSAGTNVTTTEATFTE